MRRLIVCIIAAAFWAALATASAAAADWTQFRFGATQAGANPQETTLVPDQVGALAERWRTNVGGEVLWAAPLVIGDATFIAAYPNTVTALSADTGQIRWQFVAPLGVEMGGPIASGDGCIYVQTQSGPFYALSATTGAVVWQRNVGGTFTGGPVFADGSVYLTAGGRLWALAADTGATRWSRQPNSIETAGAPAVSNGLVVLGAVDQVTAYAADTGAWRWSHQVGDPRAVRGTGISVSGGAVYAASERVIARLSLATGKAVWTRTLGRGNYASSTPAIAGGRMLLHIENDAADTERMSARSIVTGKAMWSQLYPHGNSYSIVTSSPAAAAGVVYLGFADGHLRAFSGTSGARLLDIDLGAGMHSSPTVANGQVEIGTLAGDLVALRLPRG